MKKANKLMVEKETMIVEMQQGARSNYHKRSTLKTQIPWQSVHSK